ncbi:MAG: AbrB/MazE/SpoVT family DNA-binding domain-containing protein [Coriobacteriia bacterium]|nr:AbrB/MazE/SpoVT family DNA-binding domain-containing protein [Coriobacteriia bacterium]
MAATTLTKWGNGQGVRIPKLICDELNLSAGDVLEIKVYDNGIHMSKTQRKPQSLSELFTNYSGDYQPVEWDAGEPVGREAW